MALDDQSNNLIVKNVESPSILKRLELKYQSGRIEYLNSYDNWIVYGCDGDYRRQQFAWLFTAFIYIDTHNIVALIL